MDGRQDIQNEDMVELDDAELSEIVGGVDLVRLKGQIGDDHSCGYCGMKFTDSRRVLTHILKVHLGK